MENEFLKLSSSLLMNLDHTKRYSGTKLVEEETLSQHIVDTIMMGLKIIDKINSLADESDVIRIEDYVMKAVYHDLEEVVTGDIPRPLKYYDDATLTSMRKVADDVAKKLFSNQFVEGESHYTIWESAKDGNAGYILKIVDTLVVANKVVKEVSILNNNYMLRVAHEVSQYLLQLLPMRYFNSDSVNFYLESIIKGAIDAMDAILKGHEYCVSQLGITNQSMI